MLDCRGDLFYSVVAVWLILSAAVDPDKNHNWSLVAERQQVRSEALPQTVWHVLHSLNCSGALLKHPTPGDDIFRLHIIGAQDSPEGGSNFSILPRLLRSIGWRTLNVHLVGYTWGGKCPQSNPREGLKVDCERGAYDHVYRNFTHPPDLAVLLEPGVFNEASLWYDTLTLLLDLKVPLLLTTIAFQEFANGPWVVEAAHAWTEPPLQRCAAPMSSQIMNAEMPTFYQRFQHMCRLESSLVSSRDLSSGPTDRACWHAFLTLEAMDNLGASLLAGPIWNPFGYPAEAVGINDVNPSSYFSGIVFVMQGVRPPRFTRGRFHLHTLFRAVMITALANERVDEKGFAWLLKFSEQAALFESLPIDPPPADVDIFSIMEDGLTKMLIDSANRGWDVGARVSQVMRAIQRQTEKKTTIQQHGTAEL